jgi:hypothetical protein
LDEIARYNEDDVAATMALRDWILERRPDGLAWRDASLELYEDPLNTDELVERLKNFGEHSPEHLLGDLLNYWRRERRANTEPKFAEAASDFSTLYDDPDFITNLKFEGFENVVSRGAPAIDAIYTWPDQPVSEVFGEKRRVLFTGVGNRTRLRLFAGRLTSRSANCGCDGTTVTTSPVALRR